MKRAAALLSVLLMLLCGCDYREIDRLAIITSASFDVAEEGMWEMGLEVIDASGPENEGVKTKFYRVEGETIFEAEKAAEKLLGRTLYWGFAELATVSEEVLAGRLEELADWIMRDKQMRLSAVLLVSRAESAAALFDTEPGPEGSVYSSLAGIVEQNEFSNVCTDKNPVRSRTVKSSS